MCRLLRPLVNRLWIVEMFHVVHGHDVTKQLSVEVFLVLSMGSFECSLHVHAAILFVRVVWFSCMAHCHSLLSAEGECQSISSAW